MIKSTNYLERANKANVELSYEKLRFKITDKITFQRDLGRLVTGICLIYLIVAPYFDFDTNIVLGITLLSGAYWALFNYFATFIEPKTIELVERHEKKAKDNVSDDHFNNFYFGVSNS
ncbi:MAG: hypothetical protein VX777_10730 [Chlamydiota bacterium]|nr:hypothetical protein [Chlamydiota bacterium]